MHSPSSPRSGVQFTSLRRRGGQLLKLTGVIDESFDGAELASLVQSTTLVLDLDGVHRITSFGVREWVRALRGVRTRYTAFVRVRPAVVAQFNMVSQFHGGGHLLSFYAPYLCGGCAEESEVLVDLTQQHAAIAAMSPPEARCPRCGAESEFDDLPESYFTWAASQPAPTPPPEVELILDPQATATLPLRVNKEVDGALTALWLSGSLGKTSHLKRAVDGLEGEVLAIFQDVDDVSEEGLERLRPLFEFRHADLTLARTRPNLVALLSRSSANLVPPAIASVLLPFHCSACPLESELEHPVADSLASLPRDGTCRSCGARLAPQWSPELPGQLLALRTRPLSPAAATYLERHPEAPPREGSLTPSGPPIPDAERVPSEQFLGRYHLLKSIGRGGMAEVFLARQTGAGGFEKSVVIKKILPHLAATPAFTRMFLQEAKIAARISHANVVQIFDLGQVGNEYFISMEYVRGCDLHALMRQARELRRTIPIRVATRIVASISAGLHAAHACTDEQGRPLGIVHRDVSPHNVLLSTDGQVKIADFGIAKASNNLHHTPTAQLKGKVTYMAPEQIRGELGPIDGRADVFCAGLILYELLTLERPFKRPTEFETLQAILGEPTPVLARHRAEAAPLQPVLDRVLARNPAERYATAQEFQRELEAAAATVVGSEQALDLPEWLAGLWSAAQAAGALPFEMTPTFDKNPAEQETAVALPPRPVKG